MTINDFKLERYFAKYEFSAKYLVSSSDCDGFALKYLLESASPLELEMWNKMCLGYTDSSGGLYLREAISKYYIGNRIDNIVVASPGELSFATMNLLLNKGDHVVCVSPSYQSLYEVVRSLSCDMSFWNVNKDNWSFDVEDLVKLVRGNTKLIIINFPHNPTGSYISTKELNRIVEIARGCGAYIYSDEMYRGLLIDSSAVNDPLPPIADIYEKGISIWGVSKSFGLAGLRIGWLVSQDRAFLDRVLSFKDYLSICNSAPSELLSAIALNHPDRFIAVNIDKIRKNIEVFREALPKHKEFGKFIPPLAGSVSFLPLNIDSTSLEYSESLVQRTGIMTVPAEMFEYCGNYLRIGFGRSNFKEIIEDIWR